VEVNDEQISAFEFKWGEKEVKAPKAFRESYLESKFQTINRLSFYDFLN